MALLSDYFDRGSLTEIVNEMLEAAGLPPTSNATQAPKQSDTGIALRTFYRNLRNTLSRGWWFNKTYRQVFEPDESGYITIPNALSVQASPPLPGEMPQPTVALTPLLGGASDPSVMNTEGGSTEWEDCLRLDVVYLLPFESIPEEMREYVLAKSKRQFASKFGFQLPPYDEELAWNMLDQKDAELSHTPNIFESPETFNVVYR